MVNPLRFIDPNGLEGDEEKKGEPKWKQLLNAFTFSFSAENESPEDSYEPINIGSQTSAKEFRKGAKKMEKAARQAVSNIPNNGYASINIGKQSTFSSDFDKFRGLSFTKRGIYFTTGLDAVYSSGGTTSGSLSFGYTSDNNLNGLNIQATGGILGIGVELGVSDNVIDPSSYGWNIGIVFSNQLYWGGVAGGTNVSLYDF